MKIEVERSGGFAGISKRVSIDTRTLPRSLAIKLEKNLMTNIESRNKINGKIKFNPPDCYTYKITGEVGSGKFEINFNEFDASNDLKSVVKYILKNY